MKKTILQALSSLAILLITLPVIAQTSNAPADDFMRSTGKIYVVVAVILAAFVGLVLFLVFLDRKLTKLENQIKEHE